MYTVAHTVTHTVALTVDASPSYFLLQFNGSAFCDGVCAQTPHTAFHSTMYALAFGAVSTAHQDAAWEYIRDRINPPMDPSR